MRDPLVGDLAADEIPAAVTGPVRGFSHQAFYAWLRHRSHRGTGTKHT